MGELKFTGGSAVCDAGKCQIRLNATVPPSCLIEIRWSADEELRFSHFAQPFCLFFLLENSLKLESGVMHERGVQLISLEGRDLILNIKKDIPYRFILIPVSFDQLVESLEGSFPSDELSRRQITSRTFYPRSCILDKEGLELISLLFYGDLSFLSGEEVSRGLLRWFFQRRYSGRFQPDHISIQDARWFYEQKTKLLSYALKSISYNKMLELSGLQNQQLFRIRLKQCYGLSIPQLVREAKMAAAAGFLKNPEMTIKQIAAACGYHSVNYFTPVFSHYFHLSPNAFRKLL